MYKSTFQAAQRRRKLTKRFIIGMAAARKSTPQRVVKLAQKLDEAAKRSAPRETPFGPGLVKRSRTDGSN
jgi:hypothetical protein